MDAQSAWYAAARSRCALRIEKRRGAAGVQTLRSGWLRLLQALSAAFTDGEALEQCTIEGKT